MVRVILNGCGGRMGTVLTNLIGDMSDMKIVAGIDIVEVSRPYPTFASLEACTIDADVVVDFTSPKTLHGFLPIAVARKLGIVVATTGLTQVELDLLAQASTEIAIFRSGNMSLGINLVQQLLQSTTKVLGERFDIEIIEKHHNLKKDSPSGTALMLADSINAVRIKKMRYVCGREGADTLRKPDELGIHSLRGGTIVGQHEVTFAGQDEIISIGHQAFSRQVFATGAIAAAAYIVRQKPGIYSMQDMINESSAVTTLYTYPEEVLVSLEDLPRDMSVISHLYGVLAENDVFIDMISHTGATNGHLSVSFTINAKDRVKTEALLRDLVSAHDGVHLGIVDNITKLTVEGPGMEFQSGVAYRVFSCMAKAGIPILAVTTSESKISYISPTSDVDRAVAIIKEEFGI
ncbi:MAG: 4-hydroxy-tetrahydrodipicolinate reductase [Sphaerochaeta sp.]|nr:4-hydroxy-tetrahydrodipicolinate reductase [Sphaerochaeta sp.]PKL28962.1 MAG: 4-hydroxy-tetrahydrodipicolinate reductase [Spirochaetae bacterium HGW-Spirochaetae-2]